MRTLVGLTKPYIPLHASQRYKLNSRNASSSTVPTIRLRADRQTSCIHVEIITDVAGRRVSN